MPCSTRPLTAWRDLADQGVEDLTAPASDQNGVSLDGLGAPVEPALGDAGRHLIPGNTERAPGAWFCGTPGALVPHCFRGKRGTCGHPDTTGCRRSGAWSCQKADVDEPMWLIASLNGG